jgi:hypothetical protein
MLVGLERLVRLRNGKYEIIEMKFLCGEGD